MRDEYEKLVTRVISEVRSNHQQLMRLLTHIDKQLTELNTRQGEEQLIKTYAPSYDRELNEVTFDKADLISAIVGYRVSTEGYAVDENGTLLGENYPGELLMNDPSRLVLYKKEDFPVYVNGKELTVSLKNTDNFKFLLFELMRTKNIKDLLSFACAIGQGGTEQGLIISSGLRDSVKFVSYASKIFPDTLCSHIPVPMYVDAKSPSYPLYYLRDKVITARPSTLLRMTPSEIRQVREYLSPGAWSEYFSEEALRSYRNVHGDHLSGIRFTNDGAIRVPNNEATYEELLRTVKLKFLEPSGRKVVDAIAGFRTSAIDEMEPGADEAWCDLYQTIRAWTLEGDGVNAFRKNSDTYLADLKEDILKEKKAARDRH